MVKDFTGVHSSFRPVSFKEYVGVLESRLHVGGAAMELYDNDYVSRIKVCVAVFQAFDTN